METAAPTCRDGATADASGSNPATHDGSNPSPCISLYHCEGVNNTADITNKELKAAREAAGLYQYQVAHQLGISEDTVSRWERGDVKPTPEDVSALEKLYKAPGLWYGWMRYNYPSFRERYPEDPGNAALALSMVNAKYELADLLERQEVAIRDALDGKIDDKKAFAAYVKEAKDVHAALGLMLAKAEGEEG